MVSNEKRQPWCCMTDCQSEATVAIYDQADGASPYNDYTHACSPHVDELSVDFRSPRTFALTCGVCGARGVASGEPCRADSDHCAAFGGALVAKVRGREGKP